MKSRKTPLAHNSNHFECNVETLLGRAPIVLDLTNIRREVADNVILITGAAGSIGSELAMQICTFNPAKLVLLDQAETALNNLELHLQKQFPNVDVKAFVANIHDVSRMKSIFRQSMVKLVFHAAAYKHVPFMEKHPYEAIKTNVFGVETLAMLALAYKVQKFIFISTDKAVSPASIMGATKRVAEMYLQQLSKSRQGPTQFIITRFGNVLRSSGSFMLTFEKQIREGGPVTVTHPKVSRYMMTASEACQLVLEASAIGEDGQILFFDMGKPILIEDIALRMIKCAQTEHKIEIEYIGLRPGEKLCEDLFDVGQSVMEKAKIRVCQSVNNALNVYKILNTLQIALESGDNERMITALKMAVPELNQSKTKRLPFY